MEILDIMTGLCAAEGPSGCEGPVAKAVEDMLRPYVDEVRTDVMGNVTGVRRCGKENAKKLLVDAHMDEVGLIVTGHEDGFLRFASMGVDPRILPASTVKVLAPDGPLYGVISTVPPHVLTAAETDEAVKTDDLCIDVGMTQEEAEKAVPPGTPAIYDAAAEPFGNGMVCGKSLDDRICLSAVLYAAQLLKDARLDVDLYIMASAQEEVGLRGAKTGAFSVDPDMCIVADVCFAATPDCKKNFGECGSGADIARGPNTNRMFTDHIIRQAEKNGIPYRISAEPGGNSGTNAAVIQLTREGVATALLGIPIRYMHTSAEVASLADAESAARIIAAAAEALGKGGKLYDRNA